MTDFRCKTQISRIQTFTGPTGQSYVSMKGKFFNIPKITAEGFSLEEDIKYFENNKRFEKKGFRKNRGADNPQKDFEKELLNINGFGKSAVDKIIKAYEFKENFLADLVSGADMVGQLGLTIKQYNFLTKVYLNPEEGEKFSEGE